jgi:hypothetical protein
VSSLGAQGSGESDFPALSAGGRFVAFMSLAPELVPGDTAGRDVFVHDLELSVTELVSRTPTGQPGNGESWSPRLSSDGTHVGFSSSASDLVMGDSNGERDVFVHDRSSHTTERVSVGLSGSEPDRFSALSSFTSDGRVVAFVSLATNLVPGDTNGTYDVFVRERCVTSTASAFTGDGLNADVLAPVAARLGAAWSAPLTLGHAHGTGGVLVLKVRTSVLNGPNLVSPLGGRPTEVLVAGPLLATLSGVHDGASGDIAPQTIPDQFAMLGLTWAAQYTVAGGGFVDLSSAAAGMVGCP